MILLCDAAWLAYAPCHGGRGRDKGGGGGLPRSIPYDVAPPTPHPIHPPGNAHPVNRPQTLLWNEKEKICRRLNELRLSGEFSFPLNVFTGPMETKSPTVFK